MGEGAADRCTQRRGRDRGTLPRHRHHRSRLMLRVGFLPSDFNPMMLMLGEAEDLRRLAAVLRRFARELTDVRLNALGCCAAPSTPLTVTASPGASGIQPIA